MENVVIIGSGCAGLTAAIYAARANLKPMVLEGHEPGGQLSLTTHVENFPGFPEGILGPELIENMKRQAARFGTEFKAGAVTEVDLSERPFKITAGGQTYHAKTLIVAAGASARLLGSLSSTKPLKCLRTFQRSARRCSRGTPGGKRESFRPCPRCTC